VLGYGGIRLIAAAAGVHPGTVAQGIRELDALNTIATNLPDPDPPQAALTAADVLDLYKDQWIAEHNNATATSNILCTCDRSSCTTTTASTHSSPSSASRCSSTASSKPTYAAPCAPTTTARHPARTPRRRPHRPRSAHYAECGASGARDRRSRQRVGSPSKEHVGAHLRQIVALRSGGAPNECLPSHSVRRMASIQVPRRVVSSPASAGALGLGSRMHRVCRR
jgi:hypothetical protein